MIGKSRWDGELQVGDGWAIWHGRSGDAMPHRHVAAQAVFACNGVIHVETDTTVVANACVLIEPLAMHRLVPGCDIELVFVEPWVRWPQVARLAALVEEIRSAVHIAEATGILPMSDAYWRPVMAADIVRGDTPASLWANEARTHIDQLLSCGRVQLCDLAERLGLSGERVRHRFAQEMGLPLKRFILWRRLRVAVLHLDAGANATEAAHEAGFADSAHFARALKTMFGISAMQIRRDHSGARPGQNGSRS